MEAIHGCIVGIRDVTIEAGVFLVRDTVLVLAPDRTHTADLPIIQIHGEAHEVGVFLDHSLHTMSRREL